MRPDGLDPDWAERYLEMLARLVERNVDIANAPLTIETVEVVLGIRHEIETEELSAKGLELREETDDKSSEVFLLLSKSGVPAGALDRIETINEVYDLARMRELLRMGEKAAKDGKHEYDRTEYYLEIAARLRERGLDIAHMPLTLQTVQAVLATGDQIINEELTAKGLRPMGEIDDSSFDTLLLLSEDGLPPGVLNRIQTINEANETVCINEFFQHTANGDAVEWDEYMNRGNARGQLGRFKEAFEDYADAEALAERPAHKALIASNKMHLLLKLADGAEDPE